MGHEVIKTFSENRDLVICDRENIPEFLEEFGDGHICLDPEEVKLLNLFEIVVSEGDAIFLVKKHFPLSKIRSVACQSR